MRRLRIITGHAAGFARCWNRPLEGVRRRVFLAYLAVLAFFCVAGSTFYVVTAIVLFSAVTALWTAETVGEYRRRLQAPPGGDSVSGDRYRHVDGRSTFRRRWLP